MQSARHLTDLQYEMIARRDVARLPELYAPDGVYLMPGMVVRPVELPAVLRAWVGAFPDLHGEVTGWVETAGGVAVERRMTGTHTGALPTGQGTVPPTGRTVSWDVVDVVRVRDGLISTWRSYFDQAELFASLGRLPEGLSVATAPDPLGLAA
jgi:ketosteroid isomerase-like protein